MARTVRNSSLEKRTPRSRLTAGKKHWQAIGNKLSLGYRRSNSIASWYVRYTTPEGREPQRKIGEADDYKEADGTHVLDYFQAVKAAQAVSAAYSGHDGPRVNLAVNDVVSDYLGWFKVHRKSYKNTKLAFDKHILPALGALKVSDLTTRTLRRWHDGLASAPSQSRGGSTRKSDERARKVTANRILTYLKAALNHAYHENLIPSDGAWRRVKPFRNVEEPKVQFLTEAEGTRLINGCAEDFRKLVRAALWTGCRYGELISMCVSDFHPGIPPMVYLRDTKNSKSRQVPLNEEGEAFFMQITAGRSGTDRMFLRRDGKPWSNSHQTRPMKAACIAAAIEPVSFHILRHTYASGLAKKETSLQVIAALLGHSDTRMTSRHYAHLMPGQLSEAVRLHLPSYGGNEEDSVVRLDQSGR